MYNPYDKPLKFTFPSDHGLELTSVKGTQSIILHPFESLSKMNGHKIHDAFENSSCSDCIVLTKDMIEKLFALYESMKFKKDIVPNDILIQNTIPIRDLIYKLNVSEDSPLTYFRIVNYNDHLYMQVTLIDITTSNFYFNVGYDNNFGLYVDTRIVFVDQYDLSYVRERAFNDFWFELGTEVTRFTNAILLIWYTTQILLLNPEIKKVDMLKKGKKEKIPVRHISNENAKRKTKYIKTLYLNTELFDSHKEFQRHTLCWYVIGHYRKHGEGKVWVNGYWKGPMCHAKKNLDDGRERVI